MFLGMNFFVFILFGICSASGIYGFVSFAKLGDILSHYSLTILHSHALLSFWDSDNVHVGSLLHSLTGPWGSAHFLSSIFSFFCSDGVHTDLSSGQLPGKLANC